MIQLQQSLMHSQQELQKFIHLLTSWKAFYKDIKFHWIPSHCGVVAKEMADYVVKKGTTISQISLCKLPFNSAKLGIKRNIPADFSRYYASESQHKPWNKMVKNRNIILDFPRGNAVATF